MKEITITQMEEGLRLERMLERVLKNASAGFLYKMLRKKNITLNGRKASGNEKLHTGDTIRIYFSDETLVRFTGEDQNSADSAAPLVSYPRKNLEILYEDENIILINKKAGMLSQKAAENDVSLCEYLIGYLLDSGQIDHQQLATFRPSVCNRLDYGTSGIVCCGKTTAGLQALSEVFRDRTIDKRYYALVKGMINDSSVLKGYMRKDEASNMVTVYDRQVPGSKPVETVYEPADTGKLPLKDSDISLTLLRVHLITGRSHQIRAHLSGIGHPLAGDVKYGDEKLNRMLKERYKITSQLLHCGELAFPDSADGVLSPVRGRCFRAPFPAGYRHVLQGAGMEMKEGQW